MAKNRYLPSSDAEKVAWLANFSAKLTIHGSSLGITPSEIANVQSDALLVTYAWTLLNGSRTRMQEITAWKKLLFDGPAAPALPAVPAGFTPGAVAPPLVAPDVFGRIGLLVTRIKAHPAYTAAIGQDLGVEGALEVFDPEAMKPVISVRPVAGGLCEVVWSKGKASAIEIEVDRGAGFGFLTIDSVPNYVDTQPPPSGAAAVWKYRAIYRMGDDRVGSWSDVVICAVGG